jgi:hypothetical protein
MMHTLRPGLLLAAGVLLGLTGVASGQEAAPPASVWYYKVEGQADHEFDTDINSGGSFDVTRSKLGASATYLKSERDSIGVGLRVARWDYGFDGTTGFGGLDPWDTVNELSFGVPYRWGPTEHIDVLLVAAVQSRWESGADMSDGVTGNMLAAVSYRVSDSFSIGPGFGINSQLDDSAQIFPYLLFDWQITDNLTLASRGATRAVDGPQVALSWQASPKFSLTFGAGYEDLRFRMDDSGPAPDGVAEESGWPLYLSASWGGRGGLEVFGFAGYKVSGSLQFQDKDGVSVATANYDPTPFLGGGLRLRW